MIQRRNCARRKSRSKTKRSRDVSPDEVLFQPWFLPKRIQVAITRLVPVKCHNRMRVLFDEYGCMICGCDYGYRSNGMCLKCWSKIRARLLGSMKRQSRKQDRCFDVVLLRQTKLAKKLLGRFAACHHRVSRVPRPDMLRLMNPVDEALGSLRGVRV